MSIEGTSPHRPLFLNPPEEKPLSQESQETLLERIYSVAKNIFEKALFGVAFVLHPTTFTAGFFAGILFTDHMERSVEKIQVIWSKNGLVDRISIFVFASLSLPFTVLASSFFSGAIFSFTLYEKTRVKALV